MKDLIRQTVRESVEGDKKIPQSNLDRLMDQFKYQFPDNLQSKVPVIGKFVFDYIKKNNIKVKFLNSCYTGFAGVRTKDQVIICAPSQMTTIGDFLYTVFHEIRHEYQIRDIKMPNPLTEFDLEDFENLAEQYWEMELDADQFAKNMVAKAEYEDIQDHPMVKRHIDKLEDFI